MFHSFQLKRLRDRSFRKEFEEVMRLRESFARMLFEEKDEKVCAELDEQYKNKKCSFIEKCINRVEL